MSEQLQIAIVGGGIGGLTTALALRARGLKVTVFEQSVGLREISAGVSIHPNAALLLQRIGLIEALGEIGTPFTGLSIHTSMGEVINTAARNSIGPQGYNVHRAEFVKLLIDAQPEGTLCFDHRLVAARETNDRVQLSFANGEIAYADVVIGADGIHSVLRRELGLKTSPSSEGIMAYRGLIPCERLLYAKDVRSGIMWIGKGRSFLCYPVSSGRLMNMVAFVPTDLDSEESWTAPGDREVLAAEYAGWEDPVQETIGALDETFRWGIYDRAPLPYWSVGRMTLLGDAAHAMVPHLGQGAAQAIEDGFTLAVVLQGANQQEVAMRLKVYEKLRIDRTSRIQALAREAGRFYRTEYETSAERDRLMGRWMSATGWIRGHDAEQTAKEGLQLARDETTE